MDSRVEEEVRPMVSVPSLGVAQGAFSSLLSTSSHVLPFASENPIMMMPFADPLDLRILVTRGGYARNSRRPGIDQVESIQSSPCADDVDGYSRNFVGSSPSLSLLMSEGASGSASHPNSSKLVETTEESQAILSPRPRSLDTFSSNIPESLTGTFKSWNEESIKRRSDDLSNRTNNQPPLPGSFRYKPGVLAGLDDDISTLSGGSSSTGPSLDEESTRHLSLTESSSSAPSNSTSLDSADLEMFTNLNLYLNSLPNLLYPPTPLPNRNSLKARKPEFYKTRPCQFFFNEGFCPYGDGCFYLHNEERNRQLIRKVNLHFFQHANKRLNIFRILTSRKRLSTLKLKYGLVDEKRCQSPSPSCQVSLL